MPHPLVEQVRFARSEFKRGLQGLSDDDARKRIPPLNAITWNIGHMAWQEQNYYLLRPRGLVLFPELRQMFATGALPCTPPLDEILSTWEAITRAADIWLDTVNTDALEQRFVKDGVLTDRTFGSLVLRNIYHYWYHNGENAAIRQTLGHTGLPQFVGNIDDEAPFRPEWGQ